ncbi:MAG: O-acetylhomoserine (thiol)-lyase [Bacteroidota bacterium]
MKKQTKAIRLQTNRSANREHSVPLYLTSSFVFEDAEQGRAIFADEESGNIYSRYMNPNVDEFVDKMCMYEEAEDGLAFSTGMAAIFGVMAGLLKQGDHIVASYALFGSALQIMNKITAKWGIEVTYIDGRDLNQWESAIKPSTKLFFCETPSNPGLEIVDIAGLAKISQPKGIILAIDNCFATPIIQTPLNLGADLVIHSATKFIDGQGRVLGGVVCGKKEYIDEIRFFARHTGPSLSPFNAWVLSKSLELLELRVEKQSSNALELAKALENHPQLNGVNYPFLNSHPQFDLAKSQMKMGGGIITIDVKGGFDKVVEFSKLVKILSISPNLGDSRSIMTHPASTTHSKLSEEDRLKVGITPGLIRIAVGLEHIDDLKEDILTALNQL